MKQSYPNSLPGVHPCKPQIDFFPKWESLRLRRSLNSGEYTIHDAGDSHFYPLFKHTDIGQKSASQRPSERVSEGGSASRRDHLSKGTNFTAGIKTNTYKEPYHPTDARLVTDIAIGVQDIKVSCKVTGGCGPRPRLGGGARKAIKEWSDKSRRACELHIRNVPTGSIKCFLTLTYPESFPVDGKTVKRHLDNMKKWLMRRGVRGIWCLEFQRRGAPHYHCYLDRYPAGGVEAVSQAWFKIVGSGDPKHLAWHQGKLSGRPCLEFMRKPHAASWYASKYAVKAEQKQVPADYQHVGRFWGHWGGLRPVWSYIWGHGYAVYADSLHAIARFREERGIQKNMTVITHYTSVLRGAMVEGFDYWFPDWTPF